MTESNGNPSKSAVGRLFGALKGMLSSEQRPALEELEEQWSKRGRNWQSKAFYPAVLDIEGRRCLVVGAGSVGEEKIAGLLDTGALVKVVSIEACDRVKQWAREGRVELEMRPFKPSDLEGCFLVIAATENSATNATVFEHAEERDMLCNVVDVPSLCNFILPSIHSQGDLSIAISTSGASPAMARKVRLELASQYGNEYAQALALLGALRQEVKSKYPDYRDRKVVFERIVYSDLLEWVRDDDAESIEQWVDKCLEEGPHYASELEHSELVEGTLVRQRGEDEPQ